MCPNSSICSNLDSVVVLYAFYMWCLLLPVSHATGPQGPFGSSTTTNISPGVLTAVTQQPHHNAGADTGPQSQQHLVAYMPPQLVLLLRQLVTELTSDVQQAAEAAGYEGAPGLNLPGTTGTVDYAVAASALQVSVSVTAPMNGCNISPVCYSSVGF